jgi:hypothetical protein
MSLYRKKPVVIEAFEWIPTQSVAGTPDWFFTACADGVAYPEFDGTLTIKTMEGKMRAEIGDFVIRGIKGELYLCKPDIFAATYEEVK